VLAQPVAGFLDVRLQLQRRFASSAEVDEQRQFAGKHAPRHRDNLLTPHEIAIHLRQALGEFGEAWRLFLAQLPVVGVCKELVWQTGRHPALAGLWQQQPVHRLSDPDSRHAEQSHEVLPI
jgi:hypothetical protein